MISHLSHILSCVHFTTVSAWCAVKSQYYFQYTVQPDYAVIIIIGLIEPTQLGLEPNNNQMLLPLSCYYSSGCGVDHKSVWMVLDR